MANFERFIDFSPDVDGGDDPSPNFIPRIHRTLEEFLADTGIDPAKDINDNDWIPELHYLDAGETSKHITQAGANYLYSEIGYYKPNKHQLNYGTDPEASRFVAEIPPGSRAEVIYWVENAPPKNLTLHQGKGEVIFRQVYKSGWGKPQTIEFGEGDPLQVMVPAGAFYSLLASVESTRPFVVSGFYTEKVNFGKQEVVVQPGWEMVGTPDGFLIVPPEFRNL